MKLRERVVVGTLLFSFPQNIIFLLYFFAKNGTWEDVRGEQELVIAKTTTDNTTHLSHTLSGTQGGNSLFPFFSCLIKTDLQRYGPAPLEHPIIWKCHFDNGHPVWVAGSSEGRREVWLKGWGTRVPAVGALATDHLPASPSITRRLQMVTIFMFSQLGLELTQCQHLFPPPTLCNGDCSGSVPAICFFLWFSGALTLVSSFKMGAIRDPVLWSSTQNHRRRTACPLFHY